MRTIAAVAFAVLLATQSAKAVRIITPTTDLCSAYTTAVNENDKLPLVATGGWILGFFSGIAQGTGVDILRDMANTDVFGRVYLVCTKDPAMPFTAAAERVARQLLAQHKR